MKSLFFALALLLLVAPAFADNTIAALPEVSRPSFMAQNGNRLYVVEEDAVIHIYERQAMGYRFIRTFGKAGEGPGEFAGYIHQIRVRTDHLEIPTQNRLARFSHDGRFLDEVRLPIPVFKNAISRLGNHFVARNWQFDHKSTKIIIRLYGADFKPLQELLTNQNEDGVNKVNLVSDLCTFNLDDEHLSIITSNAQETQVKIYDTQGRELSMIRFPISGEPVTAALKETLLKPIKEDPDMRDGLQDFLKMVTFPERTPGIDFFMPVDGGFACRTYRFQGDQVEFIFFDAQGKELKRRMLPYTGRLSNGRLFNIHDGAFHRLVENLDQEVWEIISTPL